MSVNLVNKIKKIKVGNPTAKSILLYLADVFDEKTGRCNPSQDQIANHLELNRATVSRKLAFLEEKGFIKREGIREKGRFYSYNYALPCDFVQHEQSNTKKITRTETNTVTVTPPPHTPHKEYIINTTHTTNTGRVRTSLNGRGIQPSDLGGPPDIQLEQINTACQVLDDYGLLTQFNRDEWNTALEFAQNKGLDLETQLLNYLEYLETNEIFKWRSARISPKFFSEEIHDYLKKSPNSEGPQDEDFYLLDENGKQYFHPDFATKNLIRKQNEPLQEFFKRQKAVMLGEIKIYNRTELQI